MNTSPPTDIGITSPDAPSPQTLRSPNAWTPRPQRLQDGRTTDSPAAGPQKAADPQLHNGSPCAAKPPTKVWSVVGALLHDQRPQIPPPQPEGNSGSEAERRMKSVRGQTKIQNRTVAEERNRTSVAPQGKSRKLGTQAEQQRNQEQRRRS